MFKAASQEVYDKQPAMKTPLGFCEVAYFHVPYSRYMVNDRGPSYSGSVKVP